MQIPEARTSKQFWCAYTSLVCGERSAADFAAAATFFATSSRVRFFSFVRAAVSREIVDSQG